MQQEGNLREDVDLARIKLQNRLVPELGCKAGIKLQNRLVLELGCKVGSCQN